MSEQELIEFLKKNLRVEVEDGTRGIIVRLYLGKTLIFRMIDDFDSVQIRY